MENELAVLKLVKNLNNLAYRKSYSIKISSAIKDNEYIIVFQQSNKRFGMRYNKINHLVHENILEWVYSNFCAKVELKWLEDALNDLREGKFDEYERDIYDGGELISKNDDKTE